MCQHSRNRRVDFDRERSLQVLKSYLVDVPSLRSGTQVSLQETILDLISTAISKDTELTDIAEMYVLHIPVSSVKKTCAFKSTCVVSASH